MKENNFFANIDKDTVCFVVVLLMFAGFAGVLGIDNKKAEPSRKTESQIFTDSLYTARDGVEVDYKLPERTNTGDTLIVVEKNAKRKNIIYAQPIGGDKSKYKIMGADRVKPGDTIVINPEHRFLMKNITQRNLERQK